MENSFGSYDIHLKKKSSAANTLKNVPYHHNLKNSLEIKSNILINGFIPPAARRFSVDLCSHFQDRLKNKKSKYVVFHFNPRFGQNCVVRNTYINGEWGNEEVHATKKNPFRRGNLFIMEIYVMKSEYLVSVNGVHFCSFTHRINPTNVDSIDISGDVQLLKVELSVRDMYPSTERTIFLVDDPLNKTDLPFCHEFKYPLMEKWDLTITGTVLDNAERFAVDLCGICDSCIRPHKNIVFHLNPRLTQKCVVRNSCVHEQWLFEESHATQRSPFKRGETFVLEIFVTMSGFMVSVNGVHFCHYQHKLPPSSVDSMEISGDIYLQKIDLCRKNSYPTKYQSLYPILDQIEETNSVNSGQNSPSSASLQQTIFNFPPEEQICRPIIYPLNQPLTQGTIIEINGRVLLLPYEFFINLQNDINSVPHPIIPYHLSVRWRSETGNSLVVNSWIDGHWNQEEVFSQLLRPNSNFRIIIYVKKEGYSTEIKAPVKPYSTVLPLFVHRINEDIVNYLYIQGDVHIYNIQVRRNMSNVY